MFQRWQILILIAIVSVACVGINKQNQAEADARAAAEARAKSIEAARPKSATAILQPVKGTVATGIVNFTRNGEKIAVKAEFQGLEAGQYIFRINPSNDCNSTQTGNSAEHLNPRANDQDETGNFIGFSNGSNTLEADEIGAAKAEFIDESLSLEGPQSIVNHSVTIHAKNINGQTQESDEAGRPLACGVIKKY